MQHRLSKRNRHQKLIDFIHKKLKENGKSNIHRIQHWCQTSDNRRLDTPMNRLANVLSKNPQYFRKVGVDKTQGTTSNYEVSVWEAVR